MRNSRALFDLGQIVTTRTVSESIAPEKIATMIRNHITGDFGILENADIDSNHEAIKHGERVLSAYMIHGKKIYVITEHDRSATTVLFADEY
jgi:ribonuclease BN (tRNA processing enzyme)